MRRALVGIRRGHVLVGLAEDGDAAQGGARADGPADLGHVLGDDGDGAGGDGGGGVARGDDGGAGGEQGQPRVVEARGRAGLEEALGGGGGEGLFGGGSRAAVVAGGGGVLQEHVLALGRGAAATAADQGEG